MSPVNPNVPPAGDPLSRLNERVRALERELESLKLGKSVTDRTADAVRLRVEVGLTASGRYGIRVYDNTGALIHDYTTAA
jgi:hypothetical protein